MEETTSNKREGKAIPTFDGKEAYWRLIKVEQQCEAMEMAEEKKFSEAEMALTGDAFVWWYFWKTNNQNAKWWDFAKALLKIFQPEMAPDIPVYVQDSGEEESSGKKKVLENVREGHQVE